MHIALFAALLGSCLVLIYVYAGYPFCLWLMTRMRRYMPAADETFLPSVSLVVSAHDEELVIEKKLQNCLNLDYPDEKLNFVFVSDGSTDRTNEILKRYESERVQVHLLSHRGGKINALPHAFERCTGRILLLSDANTYYRRDAIKKLVRHFANPQVGAVTGDVRILPSEATFGQGEGLYYRYERWLQKMETDLWSTVAIDGAMYALRRDLLQCATAGSVPDDLVIGMNVARQGYRIIYDEQAIGEEDPTPNDELEFRRKVRIVASSVQALLAGEGVPKWSQPGLLWVYTSHKVLRWFAPVFLIGAYSTAAIGTHLHRAFVWAFVLQTAFYLAAIAAHAFPQLRSRFFRVPYYFSMVNMAALLGIHAGLRGRQSAIWIRTERVNPAG